MALVVALVVPEAEDVVVGFVGAGASGEDERSGGERRYGSDCSGVLHCILLGGVGRFMVRVIAALPVSKRFDDDGADAVGVLS